MHIMSSRLRILCLSLPVLAALIHSRLAVAAADPSPTPSPTPTPTAAQKELADLQDRIDLLTKQKALLDSQRAIYQAYVPSPTATPLAGALTIADPLNATVQRLTFEQVTAFAAQLLNTAAIRTKDSLVVLDPSDLSTLRVRKEVSSTLTRFRVQAERMSAPPPRGGPAPESALLAAGLVSDGLRAALDIVALFRTDVDFQSSQVPISSFDVAAGLLQARHAKEGAPPLNVRPVELLDIEYLSDAKQSLLADEKRKTDIAIDALRRGTAASVADVPHDAAKADPQPAPPKPKAKPKTEPAKSDAAAPLAKAETPGSTGPQENPAAELVRAYDQFIEAITTLTPAGTTISLYQRALQGEAIRLALSQARSVGVFLQVRTAGGAQITRKNLFTGTRLYHSADLVVAYVLCDAAGSTTGGGLITLASGIRRTPLN